MIQLFFDGILLFFLIQVIAEEEIEIPFAIVLSLFAALITWGCVLGGAALLGELGIWIIGLPAALVIVSIGVGMMYSVEVKKSFLIGTLFLVGHQLIHMTLAAILK